MAENLLILASLLLVVLGPLYWCSQDPAYQPGTQEYMERQCTQRQSRFMSVEEVEDCRKWLEGVK